MPITPEQAKQELRRRQAMAELQKRGTIPVTKPNLPTTDETGGLLGQPGAPSIIPGEPMDVESYNRERQAWEDEKRRSESNKRYLEMVRNMPEGPERYRLASQIANKKITQRIGEYAPTIRQGFQAAGGLAGGMAGAAVGHPYLFAGLGGAAGERLYQYAEALVAPEKGMTKLEQYGGMGLAYGQEALGEITSRKLFQPLLGGAETIKPEARAAIDYLKKYAKPRKAILFKGKQTYSPDQVTDSFIIDFGGNIARSSFTGGGRMRRFAKNQQDLMGKISDNVVEQFGLNLKPAKIGGQILTPEQQAGQIVKKSLLKNKDVWRGVEKQLWDQVDEGAGLIPIEKNLRQAAITKGGQIRTEGILYEEFPMYLTRGMDIANLQKKSVRLPTPKGMTTEMDIINRIASLPDEVPLSYLNEWSSELGKMANPPKGTILRGSEQGTAAYFKNMIDKTLDAAVESGNLSVDARSALKQAKWFTKTKWENFNADIIRKLYRKNPEFFASTLEGAHSETDAQILRNILGTEDYGLFSKATVTDIIKRRIYDTDTKEFSGKKLKDLLVKDEPFYKNLFSETTFDALNKHADALILSQSVAKQVPGGMLIQLMQPTAIKQIGAGLGGGALGGYAAGNTGIGMAIGGLLVTVTPNVIARIYNSPIGLKLMTEGLTTWSGSKTAARLIPRILEVGGSELIREYNKAKKIKEYEKWPKYPH